MIGEDEGRRGILMRPKPFCVIGFPTMVTIVKFGEDFDLRIDNRTVTLT